MMTARFAKVLRTHEFGAFTPTVKPGELVNIYGQNFWKMSDGKLIPAIMGGSNTAISALTEVASPALDAQEVPCNDAGTTKKIVLGTDLKPWIGKMLRNSSVAQQALTAAATTYVTGSNITVPVGKLRAGTSFKWRIWMDKTAAGTSAANSVLVKVGTLGTTSDATIATLTPSWTPTANVDDAFMEIGWTVRTIGAAATSQAGLFIARRLNSTTGFANSAANLVEVIQAAGSTFDSTTASLIVGLSITLGAAVVWNLQQVLTEADYL